MQKVASAGPNAKPVANTASWIEFARSKVMPAGLATSGTSDFLAVEPEGETTFFRVARMISPIRLKPQRFATSGNKSVKVAVIHSPQIATLLRPNLSITEPITGITIRPGIAVRATTKPADAAEPLISSAIHGMAINTIEPEVMLVSDASWVRTKGATLRCTFTSSKDRDHLA